MSNLSAYFCNVKKGKLFAKSNETHVIIVAVALIKLAIDRRPGTRAM